MFRDLRLHLVLICLPALVLTGVGGLFLQRLAQEDAEHVQKIESERIENLAASLQVTVHESGRTGEVVRAALTGWTGGEDVRRPVGAFIWEPTARLVWNTGVPRELASALGRLTRWNEWVSAGKKRARRGLMPIDVGERRFEILWGRVEDAIYGEVFADPPLERIKGGRSVWWVGGVLVALLVCVLLAGVVLVVRAAAKARLDDQTKTTFLSNCSHELKTPLAGIGIWADLLRRGRLQTEEKRRHAYEIIASENGRMIRLVENLLDFSRLEQGRRRYRIEKVDLAPLVQEIVDFARADFSAHGIQVRAESSPCWACADVDAVKQILVNLLGNAAKYAAHCGPVDVAVSRADGLARIRVSDRGPGLKPHEMKHVFDRFYRADDALASSTGGLGLGLSIARALARDMNGELTIAARDGGGCVFALELMAYEPMEGADGGEDR